MYARHPERANPGLIVFLVDQSWSMHEPASGTDQPKAEVVSDALNRLIATIVTKCSKPEGLYDYFHLALIGYGDEVRAGFPSQPEQRRTVPISLLGDAPARLDKRLKKSYDGAGGVIDEEVIFPVWIDPLAEGGTPMTDVFRQGRSLTSQFLVEHPDCYPPVILNLTDGQSTDGDPTAEMEELTKLRSSDGEVLLFNLHVSSRDAKPIVFPAYADGLPDKFAEMLFNNSSVLPPTMRDLAQRKDYRLADGARGFAFNADIVSIVDFISIGTEVPHPR